MVLQGITVQSPLRSMPSAYCQIGLLFRFSPQAELLVPLMGSGRLDPADFEHLLRANQASTPQRSSGSILSSDSQKVVILYLHLHPQEVRSDVKLMALQEISGPVAIQIDASAHCQLACPSCPTASGATRAAMGAGHLDPAAFERLLEANPSVQEVELSNYGEMFLNPKLRELLRIAFEHRVVLHADNGTNLNHASEETLEALVRYRFRSLSVSIDGASPETYSRYRVKAVSDGHQEYRKNKRLQAPTSLRISPTELAVHRVRAQ